MEDRHQTHQWMIYTRKQKYMTDIDIDIQKEDEHKKHSLGINARKYVFRRTCTKNIDE